MSGSRDSSEPDSSFLSRNFFASRNDCREELFREGLKKQLKLTAFVKTDLFGEPPAKGDLVSCTKTTDEQLERTSSAG